MKTTALCIILLLQASLFFVLPSIGAGIFLSPDETANAVSARLFAQSGGMRFDEPLLREFPWMHPRSFVTQNAAMVPVGFLGMPLFLGLILFLVGDWGLTLVTPLLALAVLFPLWKFMARFGRTAQIATVLTWLSFPTVILYANRGLFANLPVVCLTVWACFLLWEKRTAPRSALAGLAIGFALAMRPIEIVWIIPWLAVAWRFRQDRRTHFEWRLLVLFAISMFVPLAVASFVAWKTYGSPFAIGYFLRDPMVSAPSYPASGVTPPTNIISTRWRGELRAPSYVARWPFGFHPRNVLFNLVNYFGKMLWPWTILTLAGIATLWKQKRMRPVLLVAVWTVLALTLVYGQSIYQDHVGVNVISIGNSFLRYLLPFAVLVSLTAGYICEMIKVSARGLFCVIFVCFLVFFGTTLALFQDAEGVVPARHELRRYQEIREAAVKHLRADTVILSARSDKLFFPMFSVTSPLPSPELIQAAACRLHLAVFTETHRPQFSFKALEPPNCATHL